MNTRSMCCGVVVGVVALASGFAQAQAAPKVVKTVPEIGAKDVDPATTEVRVTFDQPMAGGFSWTGGGDVFPEVPGTPHWEADKKTCVLPVKLAAGKFYRMGINSSGARNFKSEAGSPAEFNVIYFTTKDADAATVAKLAAPKIVSMDPANGAKDVAVSTAKMVVTFDRPMAGGFSWTKTDGVQPEGTGKPEWNTNKTVCTLPVKLVAGQAYSIGLNHPFANNFQSEAGVPLAPIVWTFTAAAQ